MNGRAAKKLRKIWRKNSIVAETAFMQSVKNAKLGERIWFAFKIVFKWFVVAIFLTSTAYAADLSRVAQAHIGRGEEGADNSGKWVEKYTRGKRVSWCAGFVSYVLREAGYDLPYTLWARDFARISPGGEWQDICLDQTNGMTHCTSRPIGLYGSFPNTPKPGDIVVFKRGTKSGHVAIVDQVLDRQRFWVIEGNRGAFPAKVKRNFVDTSKDFGREVIEFVRPSDL